MTGFWFQLLALLAAVNPPAVSLALGEDRRALRAIAAAAALAALLALAAVLGDPLVGALDVAPESFRMAAGIVMAVQAAGVLWDPRFGLETSEATSGALVPVAWPIAGNAAALLATMSFAVDGSPVKAVAVALPAGAGAGALALLLGGRSPVALAGAARLAAALLMVTGVALAVGGVRDI